jgi:hypothetical protein
MGRSGQPSNGRQQPARAPGSIAWYPNDADEIMNLKDALLEVANDLGHTLVYVEQLAGSPDKPGAIVRAISFTDNGVHWDEPHEWDSETFALLVEKARQGAVRRAAYSTGWPWNWAGSVRSY